HDLRRHGIQRERGQRYGHQQSAPANSVGTEAGLLESRVGQAPTCHVILTAHVRVPFMLATATLLSNCRPSTVPNSTMLFPMQEEFTMMNGGVSTFGYIDESGRWVVPAQYASASKFIEDAAVVSRQSHV